LLLSVVNLITERFGFYYAAVFTNDSQNRYAILREATGEAGSILKAQGHQLEIGGQSMVGYAIAHHRLRIALDVGAEAVRFANPLLPNTRSEIALPLVVGDQVLGALDVQSTEEAAFDESNAAVLQSMADQIAIALSNALSYTEAQAVARRSHALFAASREVGRVQADVADTIRVMMQAAADPLEYDRWCVLTFNDVRTELVTIAARDWPDSASPLDVQEQANHPLVRSAARNETVQIGDPVDVRWHALASARLRNLLSVPIAARGSLIGTVAISRSNGAALTDGDLEVGRSLATLAAIAIENYALLQSSQRTLRELDEANRQLTGVGWEKFARQRGQRDIIWVSRSDQLQPQPLLEVAEALARGHVATRLLDDGEQLGVAVPIKLRDVPIGTLRLIVPLHSWTTELSTSLESIAGHVAQAAENARLIAASEERLARERALTEATEKVRQRNEIDSILETAAGELARYLNVNRIAVRLSPTVSPSSENGPTV
jgi:GAF domain-containing protein